MNLLVIIILFVVLNTLSEIDAAEEYTNELDRMTEECCDRCMEIKSKCNDSFNFVMVMERCMKTAFDRMTGGLLIFGQIPNIKVTKERVQPENFRPLPKNFRPLPENFRPLPENFRPLPENFRPLADDYFNPTSDDFDPLASTGRRRNKRTTTIQNGGGSYSSYTQMNGGQSFVQSGGQSFVQSGPYTLVLNRKGKSKMCISNDGIRTCYEIDLNKDEMTNRNIYSQLKEPKSKSDCPVLVTEIRERIQSQTRKGTENEDDNCY